MKAVIMAGGDGTRLKAITGALPKPMVPLLGKPMLEHIVELLKRNGFDEICMAVKYHAGDIIAHFDDGGRFGVKICYRIEKEALGTAGAVKNCADFYGGDDFLVISGDCACDMNLSLLSEEHVKNSAAATIALHRDGSPLRYGLAVTDAEGRIRAFVEKPTWRRVVTDLVNTGIYMLSPKAMQYVPFGVPFDFGKDLFPMLLKENVPLYGVDTGGYWCDVGTPLSYYGCCADALSGKLKITPAPSFLPAKAPAEEAPFDDGIDCPCSDRAAVMGVLSEALLEMDSDYSDGIRVCGGGYEMHIAPRGDMQAIHVCVHSSDAEFAKTLMLSAKELIEALDLRN